MPPTNDMIVENKEIKSQASLEKETEVKIADLLKRVEFVPAKKNEPIERKKLDKDKIIKNANNKFLLEVLSPQIEENEEKKRKHKDWLMIAMGIFLAAQFIIVAAIIGYSGYHIIQCHIKGIPFSDNTLKIIFGFIGTYITSVVIELIAILKYIVKNVFDTSIVGMANDFKDK